MFGRLGMYRSMQDDFRAQHSRRADSAGAKPAADIMIRPGTLGMFVRVACVVAIIWGGAALAVWTAG